LRTWDIYYIDPNTNIERRRLLARLKFIQAKIKKNKQVKDAANLEMLEKV
jgi:hypothetical protein